MPEPFLQRQFAHAALPHLGCVGMPQGVRSNPRRSYFEALAMALKEFDQCSIAQRPCSVFTLPADEEDERRFCICRPFLHNVGAQRLQRLRFVEIDDSFNTRFRSSTARMIGTIADGDAATTIFNILQM